MKNVSLSISPYVMPFASGLAVPQAPAPNNVTTNHSINFSAQFDNEDEALKFASFLIGRIRDYKAENSSGVKS